MQLAKKSFNDKIIGHNFRKKKKSFSWSGDKRQYDNDNEKLMYCTVHKAKKVIKYILIKWKLFAITLVSVSL